MADLIIFDCDGTLVDSEYLYNAITSELLGEIGLTEYTPELCLELFAGHTWTNIKMMLEDKHGHDIPDNIIERYADIANDRMDTQLKTAPHAHDVLKSLHGRTRLCVASNGQRDNVIKSLTVTGLMDYFHDDIIFTKIQVENGKPAPDLFHFALNRMQADPENTLVIEDSPTGVTGAKAAGLRVLGYTGTAHQPESHAEALLSAGADDIIDSLIHISGHIGEEKG